MIATNHGHYMLDLLQNPDKIRSRLKKRLIKLLGMVSLDKLLATVLRNTAPIFLMIGRKEG